ncbi:iron-siderophore ABC transporter substrate-binding protein [Inquilinus sp.]|jgi:ABC-type Fe3+-hydroxamate transport system substrate-binding protein|uniref:iron-siderophore ABC transporter substrate-binding protein n=1 Tax=Inquilinus sp. TaxID=1932117 RepID=UPI0037832875
MNEAPPPWRRRPLLATLAGLGLVGLGLPAFARAEAVPRRIAAIDWAMLETLVALGVEPVAAAELQLFRVDAVEPALPPTVVDLGLRGSPNFELLTLLRPELILTSPYYTRHRAILETIAPTISLTFYQRGEPPLAKALAAVTELGRQLDLASRAEAVLAGVDQALAAGRDRLSGFAGRPTYVINIGDARHFRSFGRDSMFGDVLDRLGLPNAWTRPTRFSFAAPVPIEALAETPEARIVIVSDIPVEARASLAGSVLWNALPAVRQNRVLRIGNVNPFGGVTAGLRFARLLADALLARGDLP